MILETGRLARQANGAVYAEYGGSPCSPRHAVLEDTVDGLDYVPLHVEYNEKAYAAGKIPGSIFKREGRPKDREILVSRLIDRPLRPLFSKDFKRDIQVVPTVISADQENPTDVVAMVAASAAVAISDIPFDGPVGAVRVAEVDGELVVNPTTSSATARALEIVVAGTETGITMVEGGADEASEERMVEAVTLAHERIRELCRLQLELVAAVRGGDKCRCRRLLRRSQCTTTCGSGRCPRCRRRASSRASSSVPTRSRKSLPPPSTSSRSASRRTSGVVLARCWRSWRLTWYANRSCRSSCVPTPGAGRHSPDYL